MVPLDFLLGLLFIALGTGFFVLAYRRRVQAQDAAMLVEEDDEGIEEDYMALLAELMSDELVIANELSRIAKNPLGLGMCVFCGQHFASELCPVYPTYKTRIRLVEREKRCRACGSKDHKRMKKYPPCDPLWCLFCQKKFHHKQYMCEIFVEGLIDEYVQ